jgi:hypothetical protein
MQPDRSGSTAEGTVLTSFLTGAKLARHLFFLEYSGQEILYFLGFSSWPRLIMAFPDRVLPPHRPHVSLWFLELELPFPFSATPLSLSNVASTLFSKNQLSLLAAFFFPACARGPSNCGHPLGTYIHLDSVSSALLRSSQCS